MNTMKKLLLIVLMAFSMIANASQGTHWSFNSHMQYNMTITGEMFLNGVSMRTNSDAQYLEIGVFCGDECRGSYLPDYNNTSSYQGYVYWMQVYSNATSGETMNFKVYNHQTGEEMAVVCISGFTFQSDANFGSLKNPYAIHFFYPYDITATANPTAGGVVTGAGTYNHGSTCTLVATPTTGYTFQNWTKGTTVVSTDASYSFTVTEAGDYTANFQLNSYDIAATANPTQGGTVIGAGTYNHGATATLVATQATGYTFQNWTKGGVIVSTNPSYSFTVEGAGEYVANFTLNSYAITAAANPAAGGAVSGTGTYNHGETATLVATPATGYTFTNWKKGNTVVSTEASYSFTVTETGAYTATFTLNSYNITTTANPTQGGTLTGAGTYNHGATATLVATQATGYTFQNWTKGGNVVSTNASYTFTVEGAGEYVANFTLNSYAITATANPTAGGTVTGAGTFNHGQSCTLTATTNVGYTFQNWTKNGNVVSTNASYTFTVTEAGAYVANFTLNSYAVAATANPTNGGNITGTGTYNHGATATLTATAATASGYHFVNWTKDTEVMSTSATYSFTVTEAVNLVANFALNNYNVTVSANPTVGGTATGGGTYNWGATAHLVATPATGYNFTNWTKNGQPVATTATYDLTVTEAGAYVANFAKNVYAIAASADPTQGGTITGAGNYEHGSTVTLVATAATGYTFQNWTKGGSVVSTNPTYSFTANAAGTYVAHFTLNSYAITATANPTAGGTVTGANTYNHGASCTLTATPATGYDFINWTKGGQIVSTNASYSFTVTEAGAYTANFQLKSYNITATATPTAGGTVTGANTYNHGATCTLVATPNTGYTFVNWKKGNTVVSTNASYSFTVTEAGSYTATFSLNSYAITATANPTAGGTVSGAGTFNHGQSCTLIATPATGYAFVNWTKGGTVVSTNASYTFTVTEAGAYTANFQLKSYNITATANPTAGGTVTGAGSYNHFSTCTLTATPATGYTFVNWKKGSTVVSTDAAYSFTVTEAGAYTATFSLNSYEINVSAKPTFGGTVTGAGTYNHGSTATLTATANTGYNFTNWTKNGAIVSTNVSYSFTVTEAGNYVANFTPNNYQITVFATPAEGGTVTGGDTYAYGHTCVLYAVPNEGYYFINWKKNDTEIVSTNPAYLFQVYESAAYVAHFALNAYEITATANPTNGGTIEGAGNYEAGTTATLTATAATGYTFVNWTDATGTVVSTDAAYSFTVTADAAFLANFELNSYAITVAANPAEGGTVTGAGNYNHGVSATLTATANAGYTFINWTKDNEVVSTNASYTFTVTETGAYIANFELNSYEITVAANPEEGGTVTGDGTYIHGATATLVATPATGYEFINWTKGNAIVSTNATYTFTVTEGGEYIANFAVQTFEVVLTAAPEDMGSVEGAGTYNYGETATVTATPNGDCLFVNWTENGEVVSEEPEFSFVVTADRNLVAHFDFDVVIENSDITYTVYPNPTIDKLIVESKGEITLIEIYNISGNLIYSRADNSETVEIDVNNFSAGTYIIRLTSKDLVQTKRFIKK